MCVFMNLEVYGPYLLKHRLHSTCVELSVAISQISPSILCVLRINPRFLVLVQTPLPAEQSHQPTFHFK